jgi:hypothetical protein
MKTTLKLVTVFFLFFSVQSHAQQRVALQSNGATTIYDSNNPFVDAYNNAVSGDTIYLSGGAMSAPATIDKSLTIFGAGFHEDSTTATFFTKVTGGISIGENADNLHLEGIFFDNNISSGDASFMNSEIKRCYFKGAFSIYGTSANYTENLVVSECVFENGLNLQNTRNCLFTNNIFNQQVSYTSSNLFSNNIFLREGGSWSSPAGKMIFYAYNNVFENNVLFNSSQYYLEGSGNLFQYNLFVNGAPELGTGFIDVNNYYGVLQSTVFVNQVGFTWATTNDNHLQDPATYVGADATPVGIYGGFFPFKAGAVPQNPHISSKIISNQTDINGDLNIQILTGAQND